MRWLACALVLASCFDEPSYEGLFCDPSAPCPDSYRCVAGQCTDRPPAPLDAGDEALDASAGSDALAKDAAIDDAGELDSGPDDAGDPITRCGDPVTYPSEGWEVRHFTLSPGFTLDACFGVEDLPTETIARDFQEQGPFPGGGPTDFGSRYSATRDFQAGVYTFTVEHDDGIRIRIDGTLIYDGWLHGHLPFARAYSPYLQAGPHQIDVEHFDDEGFAQLSISWQRGCLGLTAAARSWIVSYHAYDPATNALVFEHCYGFETVVSTFLSFSGPPAAISAQSADIDYAIVGRAVHDFPGLTFIDFDYQDGLRADLDGARVIDDWATGPQASLRVQDYLPNPAEIYFEKFATTPNDAFSIRWTSPCDEMPALGATDWWARYYRVLYVASPESWALDRDDCLGAQLIATDRLMQVGEPPPIVNLGVVQLWGGEFFAQRSFAANTNVTATYDDGVRLFDGPSLVLDDWTAPQVETMTLGFGAGAHSFRVEYFQNFGGTQLQLTW